MNRDFYAHCRMSLQELQALELLAARRGMGLSEALRTAIRETCAREGISIGLMSTVEKFPDALQKQPAIP